MLDLLELPFVGAIVVESGASGDRFDATNSGGDAGLTHDLEDTDLRCVANVRAAAQLHADTGNRDDADDSAVLLVEE